ncbi:MAG: hypothetical protein EXQ52_05025 [Bryobacterales bacterium]|nr:hypothetical protein [Bryobacterales bacterium]
MTRSGNEGYWDSWSSYYSIAPSNVNALEANGHLEGGPAANPYTETVQRGLRAVFSRGLPLMLSPAKPTAPGHSLPTRTAMASGSA